MSTHTKAVGCTLYPTPGDFVYSVSRDFVRSCQTPMLVMPDDTPAHPYPVSMEIAAPGASAVSSDTPPQRREASTA